MPDQVSNLKYSSNKISGLATGMDTEALIEDMMKAERQKVIKVEQELQYAQWEQEAYRDLIGKLNDFTKDFFNISDNTKNMFSDAYLKTIIMDSNPYASITALGEAASGSHIINEIVQIAKASTVTGNTVKSGINGSELQNLDVDGLSFNIRLDGDQHTISFDKDYTDKQELISDLQAKLDEALGVGRATASLNEDGGIRLDSKGSTLQILDNVQSEQKLDSIGLRTADMNIVNVRETLANNFGVEDDISFAINGVEFNFTAKTSISDIMKEINLSSANVKMSYNSITDKITLTSSKTGSGIGIDIENISGSFFGENSISGIEEGVTKNGQDAIFYLNDADKENPITRNSNSFTIDNVSFSLKAETTEEIAFSVENNTKGVFDSIKNFINDYNKIVYELNNAMTEKKDYEYFPLSKEQKGEMKDKEIDEWEEKAKAGILKSDNLISSLLSEMRTAFFSNIEGVSIGFGDIGLSTTDYQDNGKITIDENKLRQALDNRFEEVHAFFNKESNISYSRDLSESEVKTRYAQNGFAQRVNDILKKYVTTSRDKNGYKGLMIEKAGAKNDASDTENSLAKRIKEIKERLDRVNERMDKKEQEYWSKFGRLESAIYKMNSQTSFLNSMLEK